MNKISSYDELLKEKQRLQLQLSEQQAALRSEFEDIKSKLKPLTGILAFTEKITKPDSSNPLVNTGIDVGVNFLLRKVLLRNAGWIFKLLTPVLVRNYLSHEVKEHPDWLKKVIGFVRKQFS